MSEERVDRLGALASSLCAVHCAVGALLPAAFGALGLGFLMGHNAEWVFTLIAIAFALGALVFGWRKHRSVPVATLLALGITGLLASRILESGHGHHEDEHHQAAESDEHSSELHSDAPEGEAQESGEHEGEHHDSDGHEDGAHHESHEGGAHGLGTAVGVLAGLLLLLGHVFNIRATRRRRDECCD